MTGAAQVRRGVALLALLLTFGLLTGGNAHADTGKIPTDSRYSSALNSRIQASMASTPRIDANQSAIAAHNRTVASYPGGAVPPSIANTMNA